MFYDIEQQIPISFATEKEYLDFCQTEYFKVCKNLSVLEIGPGSGNHSRAIIKEKPKSLEIVEGHLSTYQALEQIADITKSHYDDAMLFLKQPRPFDVVICLGVLYHLHSPLHLLELIANHCQPKFIILDCVMAPDVLQFLPEGKNIAGSNQPQKKWKSCDVNLVIPFLIYLQTMEHLGYENQRIDRISVKNYFPKQNSWMALWEISQ